MSVRIIAPRAKPQTLFRSRSSLQGDGAIAAAILSKLSADFEDSLLPFRVDLVDWAVLSPEFKAAIGGDLERLGE